MNEKGHYKIEHARVGEVSKTEFNFNGYELAAIILALGVVLTLLLLTQPITVWLIK